MRHAEKWRALPPEVRATFGGKARRHAHAVQERLRLDTELLMERIRAQRLVVEEAALSYRPLRIGDCRFTERGVTRLDATRIDPCSVASGCVRSWPIVLLMSASLPLPRSMLCLSMMASTVLGSPCPSGRRSFAIAMRSSRDALLQCRPYGGEVQRYVFLHGANAPRKGCNAIPLDKVDGIDMAFEVHGPRLHERRPCCGR